MSRPRNKVPSLRRHRFKNRQDKAFIQIDGERVYLGKWGSKETVAAYARLVAEVGTTGRMPRTGAARSSFGAVTTTELIVAFMKFAKKYYCKDGKPTQGADNFTPILKIVRRLYGSLPVDEFGPTALKVCRNQMVEQENARTYINGQVNKLRRVFAWGVEEELVPSGVYEALRAVAPLLKGRSEVKEPEPIRPVSTELVDLTLPHLPPIIAAMVKIQRLTGARPNEVIQMRPVDINRSGEVWIYTPGHHKTAHHGQARIIPIGPKAQAVLMPYLDRKETDYCFDPREGEALRRLDQHRRRTTPLSCGNKPGSNRVKTPARSPGDCYTTNTYRKAIHRACKKAGIEQWSPNRLRHSAGTEIRERFGLEAAQIILGHAKADTTQLYAERDVKKALEVARELG